MTAKKTPVAAKCENCAHFHAFKADGFVIETVCRRFPPTVVTDGQSSAFPIVLEDDLCGEHKPKSQL